MFACPDRLELRQTVATSGGLPYTPVARWGYFISTAPVQLVLATPKGSRVLGTPSEILQVMFAVDPVVGRRQQAVPRSRVLLGLWRPERTIHAAQRHISRTWGKQVRISKWASPRPPRPAGPFKGMNRGNQTKK